MRRTQFDALVIGSGPAGSVAALVLARGGARVALVDKASFPRDKACGDMVGPRGVQLLADLGRPVEEKRSTGMGRRRMGGGHAPDRPPDGDAGAPARLHVVVAVAHEHGL